MPGPPTAITSLLLQSGTWDGRGLDREHLIGDADAEMQSGTRLLAGSPATVRDTLIASLAHLGSKHNYLAPAFQWGDMTHQEALHSLTLFATEVMPALARTMVGASASVI